MASKASFIMMTDWYDLVEPFDDSQIGELMRLIFLFERGEEIDIDSLEPALRGAAKYLIGQIGANDDKYADLVKKRSEAGKKGAKAKQANAKFAKAKQAKPDFAKAKQVSVNFAKHTETETETETVTETDNTYSSELSPASEPAPESPAVPIPLNDGSEWHVPKDDYAEFVKLYPNVDVGECFRNMRAWSLSNPKRRKTRSGVMKFVNTWLSKEQDRNKGVRYGPAQAAARSPSGRPYEEYPENPVTGGYIE